MGGRGTWAVSTLPTDPQLVRDWGPAPLGGLSPEAFLGKRSPCSQGAAAKATEELGDVHIEVCVCVCMRVHVCVHVCVHACVHAQGG